MNLEHLAKEAARLKDEHILTEALQRMKTEAYEALSKADADDKTQILRLQQKIAVIEEIPDMLETFILEGKPSAGVRRGLA